MRSPAASLAIGAALTLALVGASAAAPVPRAEEGLVEFIVGDVQGLETPVTVRRGDVAWRAEIRPALNARLEEDTPERVRPGRSPGVPAGALLWGYTLSSGVAYCPYIDFRAGASQVQCFRDFDGDGTFDGRYVTRFEGRHSSIVTTMVHGLEPMAKARYSKARRSDAQPVLSAFIYNGEKGGRHLFRMRVEDAMLDKPEPSCFPKTADTCTLWGMTLSIKPAADGGVVITLIDEADPDYDPPRTAALPAALG